MVRIQECTGYAPHGVCRCWGRRAPAPAPPGTLRIPGEPVNFPYRILNPGACMICIGGVAESETSDACTACLEPRCTRRKQGAQKRCAPEGGRVPKRSSSRGQWSGPWDACGGASWGVPRDASWGGSWNAPRMAPAPGPGAPERCLPTSPHQSPPVPTIEGR